MKITDPERLVIPRIMRMASRKARRTGCNDRYCDIAAASVVDWWRSRDVPAMATTAVDNGVHPTVVLCNLSHAIQLAALEGVKESHASANQGSA